MIVRNDWTFDEINTIYTTPLLDLVFTAAQVHRENASYAEVQISSLVSIKTGGCPEDCSYCPQAARYHTGVEVEPLMRTEKVLELARKAQENGASRLCMGAAWREVRDNRDFDRVLEMVREVNKLGMEVCCTLGMLNADQARKLEEAGVYAYNHNIDTSREDYGRIITTRTFDDRLETLQHVRNTRMTVCSGGIIGLGETVGDRVSMLQTLATMKKHPESVSLNMLVRVRGTPLADAVPVPVFDMVRLIATARIIMPQSVVRISAGRTEMTASDQALCFMAGANSLFIGEKLLTTPNPDLSEDRALFKELGLRPRPAFKAAVAQV